MENTKEKAEYWGIIEDTIEEIKSIYENSLHKAYKLGFQHGKNDERQRDINYFVLDNS